MTKQRQRRMRRPGYRSAVEWIAYNDDDSCVDEEAIRYQVTVVMVADLFRVEPERVAKDVLQKRKNRETP